MSQPTWQVPLIGLHALFILCLWVKGHSCTLPRGERYVTTTTPPPRFSWWWLSSTEACSSTVLSIHSRVTVHLPHMLSDCWFISVSPLLQGSLCSFSLVSSLWVVFRESDVPPWSASLLSGDGRFFCLEGHFHIEPSADPPYLLIDTCDVMYGYGGFWCLFLFLPSWSCTRCYGAGDKLSGVLISIQHTVLATFLHLVWFIKNLSCMIVR